MTGSPSRHDKKLAYAEPCLLKAIGQSIREMLKSTDEHKHKHTWNGDEVLQVSTIVRRNWSPSTFREKPSNNLMPFDAPETPLDGNCPDSSRTHTPAVLVFN